jgi:hypothetical protein
MAEFDTKQTSFIEDIPETPVLPAERDESPSYFLEDDSELNRFVNGSSRSERRIRKVTDERFATAR